ncbi:hypothetical protein ANN_24185 [Periplaneta americana]|uniref:Mutator-like transposase domain-containing protein n=1 Tax=Periplaneta americana TaxID=6978 RepID=A0ABQ8S2N1_PERAM|nr:hypothetical protein ANN_24185 [Periplaneta americana]
MYKTKIVLATLFCNSEDCMEMFENISSRRGLATKINLHCSNCESVKATMTSAMNRNRLYNRSFFIKEFLSEIAEASMRQAAMETVELNGDNRDICGAFDGRLEVQGALNIFRQSEDSLNIRCVQYLGDSDSKGFKKVQEDKPCGEGVEIEKLECIGHVHKRMGARLGRFKKELKWIKLDDGKTLAGAGHLTNTKIDLFQTYYGLAIRRNTGNEEECMGYILP